MYLVYLVYLDWIGLDWIGLDWIGLDWIGLDYLRTHNIDQTEYQNRYMSIQIDSEQ